MEMNFVKIGDRFVNLDQVTHVEPNPVPGFGDEASTFRITAYFAAGYEYDTQPGQHGTSFMGDEAKAFLSCLDQRSHDVMKEYQRLNTPYDYWDDIHKRR